jgi:hypothetical protein
MAAVPSASAFRRAADGRLKRMRLRNRGGLEAALETVKQVKGELWNAVTAGHSAPDKKDAFLAWCDRWATPQLGNHFPPSEELFAEIAESYHRVVQTPS